MVLSLNMGLEPSVIVKLAEFYRSKINIKVGKPYSTADALAANCDTSFDWGCHYPSDYPSPILVADKLSATSVGEGWSEGLEMGRP